MSPELMLNWTSTRDKSYVGLFAGCSVVAPYSVCVCNEFMTVTREGTEVCPPTNGSA